MSVLQFGLLFVMSAPFGVALWVAFLRRRPAPAHQDERWRDAGLTGAGFQATALDVEMEVRAAADELAQFAREHSVQIQLAVPQGTTVRANTANFQAALGSVMREAIRSALGGQVLVTGACLGTQMHLRVLDDGANADCQSREGLTREAGSLIALQGGSIAVETFAGCGTAVTIHLPLGDRADSETKNFIPAPAFAEEPA